MPRDGQNINLTVIVAHAPQNDSGEQGRKSFWNPGSHHRCERKSWSTQEQVFGACLVRLGEEEEPTQSNMPQ